MAKVTDIRHAQALRQLAKFLHEAGWNLDRPVMSAGDLGGPTIYMYDVETGYCKLFAYVKDGLSLMAQQAAAFNVSFQDSCNNVAALLGELGGCKTDVPPGMQTELMVAAGLYLTGTRTYAATKNSSAPLHYLILRYPDAQAGGYLLRPSSVMTDKTLTPEEIKDCAQEVLALDRMQHPERFVKDRDMKSSIQDRSPSAYDTSSNSPRTPPSKPRSGP